MPLTPPLPPDSMPVDTAAQLARYSVRPDDRPGTAGSGFARADFACAASARGDEYLAHAMAAQAAAHEFAGSDAVLAMAASGEGRSDAETCLLMWVRKMATMPHKTVEEDMKRLHSAG